MKKFNSAKLVFAVLGIMTVVCTVGSVGSTLAWYAYSTRALASYTGTSVNSTTYLEIGICSDEPINNMPNSVHLERFTSSGDNNFYYFAQTGTGLTYEPISKYLAQKGFATNELEPLTSGSYSSGGDFVLKKAPNEIVHTNNLLPANERDDYLTIPFVFRIKSQGTAEAQYVPGKELWLSKAVVRASSGRDDIIYKALRVYVERGAKDYGTWRTVSEDVFADAGAPTGDYGHNYYLDIDENNLYLFDDEHSSWNLLQSDVTVTDSAPNVNSFSEGDLYVNSGNSTYKLCKKASNGFIFNPSAENEGDTRVGGLLNLSRDAYFDFDDNGEIIYGEYDPAALLLKTDNGYTGSDDKLWDVNGTNYRDENEDLIATTFTAKHKQGARYYTDFTSQPADALFGHAHYLSINEIAPLRDSYDYITNQNPNKPTSICKTADASDNYLARVNLTVYLEGWDFSVIDQEESHGFDLGLTFEASRV